MNASWNATSEAMIQQKGANMIPFYEAFEAVKRMSTISSTLTPCIVGVLLVVGFVGNVLVIWVSLTTQRIVKHPISSSLILNLAIADLIYLCSSAPYQAIMYSTPGWIYGSTLCRLLHFLNIQTMSVSIFTMCSLAVMRFMALMMPFTIQRSFITTAPRKSSCLVILVVWILSSILASPIVHFYKIIKMVTPETGDVTAVQCTWSNGDNRSEWMYETALLCITYAMPFLLVASLYFFIGRVVCEKGGVAVLYGKKRGSNGDPRQEEHSEIVKTTLMVFCLIIAFMVCWFPYHLSKQLLFSEKYSELGYAYMRAIIEMVGLCFSYAHACVNPIIYTFASPGWKRNLCCSSKSIKGETRGRKTPRLSCKTCLNRINYAQVPGRSPRKSSRMSNGTNQEATSVFRLTTPSLTNENSSTNIVVVSTI